MIALNARELHNRTSSVLDRVERGHDFSIVRNGKVVARLVTPAKKSRAESWHEIIPEIFAAHEKLKSLPRKKFQPNPVLAERKRRMR